MPTPEEYKLKYRPSEVEGECLLKEIATLKLNYLKYGVFILTSFLTGGIILLLLHWYLQRYLGILTLNESSATTSQLSNNALTSRFSTMTRS